MFSRGSRWFAYLTLVIALCWAFGDSALCAQVVDNPGFKALPRPVNYATPLAAKNGPQAVIVYGKNAAWTKAAAEAVQKSIQDWSGVKLELADDRTVTSDQTWLLTDAYRKTPLIVLGNARDNRVMHALGTRMLLQSNRSWPGGDRYYIRTVFEPFVADVNYISLEASTQAGMDAAAAKFAELLKALANNAGIIPRIRILGGVKDQWGTEPWGGTIPAEYAGKPNQSVAEIARSFKGQALPAGSPLMGFAAPATWHTLGGYGPFDRPGRMVTVPVETETLKSVAAMYLNGCRAAGGRLHAPADHYGATWFIQGLRGVFQAGVLTSEELNEFENAFVLSAAYPNEYYYDNIGADNGCMNEAGDRHYAACLWATVNTLDYVLGHCRMDERTRKEVQRRADGARGTAARYARSFHDNFDCWSTGETTMLQLYSMIHQGQLDVVRNGNLKRMADCYVMSNDNTDTSIAGIRGSYSGIDSYFSQGPGMMKQYAHGRGLISAAAFYYDDPSFKSPDAASLRTPEAAQYRWFIKNWPGPWWSVASGSLAMHLDTAGEMAEPSRYYGVYALPFDERLYELLTVTSKRPRGVAINPPPPPMEKAVDRVAFRDGMDQQDAYLLLGTTQRISSYNPLQNNSIPRYTDLGEIWLYHNCQNNTNWVRNAVSISNGKPSHPQAGCTLEALANLGDVSAVATRDHDVGGADWTRTIVHWRGHYFVVLDRIEAIDDDQFNMICRWRSPQFAALDGRVWQADAPGGSRFRIQNTDAVFQTSEFPDCDGSARPHVLSQFKRATLKKGQAETFQNLLVASGPTRPDEFQARRAGASAVLVKGKTAAGDHLALIGTNGQMPLSGYETDAIIFDVRGNELRLAGARTLKAKVGEAMVEVFHSDKPANLLLDCATGVGRVESPGQPPRDVKINGALPKPADQLADLWNRAPEVAPVTSTGSAEDAKPFQALAAEGPALRREFRRVSRVKITSVPDAQQPIATLTDGEYCANLSCNTPTWGDCSKLEVTLTLPESTAVSCLRLVGILKMVPAYGPGSEGAGGKYYQADDFKFSLVLSDDGFQKDVRKVESAKVNFEETDCYVGNHGGLFRLPTWRVEVSGKAKQIKLLPRPTTKERPSLFLTELEMYSQQVSDDLTAKAFAVDMDGDGSNELLLGTSAAELALYRDDGKQAWRNRYPLGDIFLMGTADLDEDGKNQALVYLASEEFHRVNADGTERAVGDIHKAQLETYNQRSGYGGMTAMAAWGPEGVKKKEVVMWSEGCYRVLADGSVKMGSIPVAVAAKRLVNLVPNEPEVLATVRDTLNLWSPRLDKDNKHVLLGSRPMAGATNVGFIRAFGWIDSVNLPKRKGVLAANEGGVNFFPIEAFSANSKEQGWGFDTGGVPVVAALAEDINGDGGSEVFLARLDGFINVLRLADGSQSAMLNTGEPILGMAMLRGKDGKNCLAVGTKFGVHLFAPSGVRGDGSDFKKIGSRTMSVAAFAGPGGKNKDRVYVVAPSGQVTILIFK